MPAVFSLPVNPSKTRLPEFSNEIWDKIVDFAISTDNIGTIIVAFKDLCLAVKRTQLYQQVSPFKTQTLALQFPNNNDKSEFFRSTLDVFRHKNVAIRWCPRLKSVLVHGLSLTRVIVYMPIVPRELHEIVLANRRIKSFSQVFRGRDGLAVSFDFITKNLKIKKGDKKSILEDDFGKISYIEGYENAEIVTVEGVLDKRESVMCLINVLRKVRPNPKLNLDLAEFNIQPRRRLKAMLTSIVSHAGEVSASGLDKKLAINLE